MHRKIKIVKSCREKKGRPTANDSPTAVQPAGWAIRLLWGWLVLTASLATAPAAGQSVDFPFKAGETAAYGAYYNLNFIWLQSGEVNFSVDTLVYQHQKAWHLLATGKTFKAYDLLMTVRDTFETFSNYETLRPLYSRRAMNHGKENSDYQYWFDYQTRKVTADIHQAKKEVYRGSIPMDGDAFDLLATAYKFRNDDFEKLFVGEKVPYSMIIDKQVANLYFRYLGKENIKTRNGQKFRCHKVSVYLMQSDFFPEGEYMKAWFTDDRNHLPVQVETKILIGSVKALLLETTNLKYPLTSKIN
jgi:hypothetical protein